MLRHRSRLWWVILGLLNAVWFAQLVVSVSNGDSAVPYLFLMVVASAILIPVAIARGRTKLLLDFDAATLTAGRKLYPATEFQGLVLTSLSADDDAHTLTFVYERGEVPVRVTGSPARKRIQARNETLLAFIWHQLSVPDSRYAEMAAGFSVAKHSVGKREVLDELRRD